jgi:hypothetical protein
VVFFGGNGHVSVRGPSASRMGRMSRRTQPTPEREDPLGFHISDEPLTSFLSKVCLQLSSAPRHAESDFFSILTFLIIILEMNPKRFFSNLALLSRANPSDMTYEGVAPVIFFSNLALLSRANPSCVTYE